MYGIPAFQCFCSKTAGFSPNEKLRYGEWTHLEGARGGESQPDPHFRSIRLYVSGGAIQKPRPGAGQIDGIENLGRRSLHPRNRSPYSVARLSGVPAWVPCEGSEPKTHPLQEVLRCRLLSFHRLGRNCIFNFDPKRKPPVWLWLSRAVFGAFCLAPRECHPRQAFS